MGRKHVCGRLGSSEMLPEQTQRAADFVLFRRQTKGTLVPHMLKGNLTGPDTQGVETRSRRKRTDVADPNQAFANAFVDALRDILRHERRRAS